MRSSPSSLRRWVTWLASAETWRRAARCDNHFISDGGFAFKLNDKQVFGFVVFKGFDHGGGEILNQGFRCNGGPV
jgi:hypothetical protein